MSTQKSLSLSIPSEHWGKDEPGGATEFTLTVTLREIDPPLPVQVRVYVVAVTGVTDSLPEIDFVPLHPPEAEQLVVFVDDQIRVVAGPGLTVAILA